MIDKMLISVVSTIHSGKRKRRHTYFFFGSVSSRSMTQAAEFGGQVTPEISRNKIRVRVLALSLWTSLWDNGY